MKKHPLITCGLTALLAASASAELLVSEDYTYPNGGIATRNGGTGWGGAWTGAGLVADGRHEFSGNDYRPISTTFVGSSTAPLYFSADFVKTGTDTSYAAWLEISNNSTQNDNDVRIGLANDQFSVRLEDQGGTDPAGEFGTYTPGTTVTIVGKLEFDVSGTSERVTVWVDPTGVETAAVSHTLTGQNVGWVTPLFTQGVRISLSGGVASVDNIKMGTTWADVAGGQASSPLALTITPTTGSPGDYDFSWNSQAGKVYDLLTSTDLATAPETWPVWLGNSGIAATPPLNTLTAIDGGGDPRRFFVVVERDLLD